MSNPRHSQTTPFIVIAIIAILSIFLIPIIAIRYSYDTFSRIESAVGFAILLVTLGLLWLSYRRLEQFENPSVSGIATRIGIGLGLLWVIEISINNLIAPPLPLRDHIDNAFWAAIALAIFILALFSAYQTGSIRQGIWAGTWSGLLSGLLACWAALSLIVFGMALITRDPLNLAEWAMYETVTTAPTMAAYFAYETIAGAFLHLVVLGPVMGALLGLIGGGVGKGVGRFRSTFGRE